jgi:hypothetical protein
VLGPGCALHLWRPYGSQLSHSPCGYGRPTAPRQRQCSPARLAKHAIRRAEAGLLRLQPPFSKGHLDRVFQAQDRLLFEALDPVPIFRSRRDPPPTETTT